MAATKIADHRAEAILAMPQEQQGKATIELLIEVCAGPANDLEDVLYQLLTERFIDTAIGAQLDLIGKIVLQARNGLGDDDYRRYLRARIAANNSEGLISDFIRVTRSVLNDPTLSVTCAREDSAQLSVYIAGGVLATAVANILLEFLQATRMGGIRLLVHYFETIEAESYKPGFLYSTAALVTPVSTEVVLESAEDGALDSIPAAGTLVLMQSASYFEITYTGVSVAGGEATFSGISTPPTILFAGVSALLYNQDTGQGDATDSAIGGRMSSVLE